MKEVMTFDARGNGNGKVCCSLVGGHQNRVTDYTAIVIEIYEATDSFGIESESRNDNG